MRAVRVKSKQKSETRVDGRTKRRKKPANLRRSHPGASLSLDTLKQVKAIAANDRRSLAAELGLLVEDGLKYRQECQCRENRAPQTGAEVI